MVASGKPRNQRITLAKLTLGQEVFKSVMRTRKCKVAPPTKLTESKDEHSHHLTK